MAGFEEALGPGTVANQFLVWGVAIEVIRQLMQPFQESLRELVFGNNPVVALSPAELADMVIRNITPEADAAAEAAKSGIDAERFHRLVLDTGEPPGLELVLEMLRRDIIPEGTGAPGEASFLAAVHTSRLRDEWADPLLASREIPISAADAVEAVLRGQIAKELGLKEAYASGINAERFQILLDTAGNPPSLGELIELKRRGLIPDLGLGPDALTFQQGIFEGDNKDKWLAKYLLLADYVPPPRSIATLQSHGVIDQATAAGLYRDNGLSPQLAGIYAASAVATKVAHHKELTERAVIQLYHDRLLTRDDTLARLGELGYDPPEANLVVELEDFNRNAAAYTAAVNRVHSRYVAHQLDRTAAVAALATLDVPAAAVSGLMAAWDAEAAANVRALTPAQVEGALFYGIKDQSWAQRKLEQLGYTPHDAWVALSVRSRGALPGEPAEGTIPGLDLPTTEVP